MISCECSFIRNKPLERFHLFRFVRCREIIDNTGKENGINIVMPERTYQLIAESAEDARYAVSVPADRKSIISVSGAESPSSVLYSCRLYFFITVQPINTLTICSTFP